MKFAGTNLAKLILVMSVPGGPQLLASDWAYRHRHWFSTIKFISEFLQHKQLYLVLTVRSPGAIGTLIDAMHVIRKISEQMLEEKMADAHIVVEAKEPKKDIMSLLVRARIGDKEGSGYLMSDQAMMDQVVC